MCSPRRRIPPGTVEATARISCVPAPERRQSASICLPEPPRISVGDDWNYGNPDPTHRLHYFNISGAFVWNTTRIALNFGKTKEGILCIGGVCRAVPASYGVGLSITTSF